MDIDRSALIDATDRFSRGNRNYVYDESNYIRLIISDLKQHVQRLFTGLTDYHYIYGFVNSLFVSLAIPFFHASSLRFN